MCVCVYGVAGLVLPLREREREDVHPILLFHRNRSTAHRLERETPKTRQHRNRYSCWLLSTYDIFPDIPRCWPDLKLDQRQLDFFPRR